MASWTKTVEDIIAASQESKSSHERLLKDLRQVYDAADKAEFATVFLRLLVYPLRMEEKSVCVDNCMAFLTNFTVSTAVSNSEMSEDDLFEPPKSIHSPNGFLVAVLNFITKVLPSTNKAVRIRGCQFLEQCLAECSAQARSGALHDDLWNQLVTSLTGRCRDKVVRVRYHAVAALARFQQPRDPNCPAITVILYLMRYDPSIEVRCQCVRLVSATKPAIGCFVESTRKGNAAVRKAVFKQFAHRKMFKYLSVHQRLTVIKNGLTDPAGSIRTICETDVINSFLESVGNDIPELVDRLDIITGRKTCELLLDALFKHKPLADLVVTFCAMTESWQQCDWLKPQRIFCLRHFIQFITTAQKAKDPKRRLETAVVEEWMEKLLPPLLPLVEFVEYFITKNTDSEELDIVDGALLRNFTVSQLIELLSLVDKSDAAGRSRMEKMFETIVPIVSPCVLPGLVRLHSDLHRNTDRTIEWMSDVISDWTVPPAQTQPVAIGFPDQSVSYLQMDGLRLEENEEEEVRSINLFKSLTLLCEVLKLVGVKTLTTTLRSLYENLILPSIQNEDPAARNLAFRCLGLSCLLDRKLAAKHVDLFLQTLKIDVEAVRKTSIEVLFDLLLVFREKLFDNAANAEEPTENGEQVKKKTAQMVVMELLEILDSDDKELHDVVAEGEAKLRLFAKNLLPSKQATEV